jgi:hypothetical protein
VNDDMEDVVERPVRSRVEQGLPERVEDAGVLAAIAAILKEPLVEVMTR